MRCAESVAYTLLLASSTFSSPQALILQAALWVGWHTGGLPVTITRQSHTHYTTRLTALTTCGIASCRSIQAVGESNP